MELLENHVRALYRFLNHGSEYSDLRAIDVNTQELIARKLVKGEEAVLGFAKKFNGRCNVFVGRNPRNADGSVSQITTFSYDLDPIREKGTAAGHEAHRRALMAGRRVLQEDSTGYLASSGNGALVLYRLKSPVRENFEAFKAWLIASERSLQSVLDSGGLSDIKVDHTHDHARIVKLLGTTSTKGDRAYWRTARFIDIPCPPYRCYSFVPRVPVSPASIQSNPSGGHAPSNMGLQCNTRGNGPSVAVASDGRGGTRPLSVGHVATKLQRATESLARLAPRRREDYSDWLQVGMSLTELGAVGLALWDQWSRKSEKYREGICEEKWKTFETKPGAKGYVSLGSLFHWADQDDPAGRHSGQTGSTTPVLYGSERSVNIGLFLAESKPVEWICPGFIARAAIGFVAGLPETMKTWLLMDLALECAKPGGGRLWAGIFEVQPATVLFIDQERAKSETQRRFKALISAKHIQPETLNERLFIRNGNGVQFDDDVAYEQFRSELLTLKPDLVIIDSFVTCHSKEENNRQEIQQVLERVKQLRAETGCTFIFLDHENKLAFSDGDDKVAPSISRMSGSIAKPAAAEFVLTVRRHDAKFAIVHTTKNTLAARAEPFTFCTEDVAAGIEVRGQK